MSWTFIFHDWIYIDEWVGYYGDDGLSSPGQIHFVNETGEMTNRHPDLLQLAVI